MSDGGGVGVAAAGVGERTIFSVYTNRMPNRIAAKYTRIQRNHIAIYRSSIGLKERAVSEERSHLIAVLQRSSRHFIRRNHRQAAEHAESQIEKAFHGVSVNYSGKELHQCNPADPVDRLLFFVSYFQVGAIIKRIVRNVGDTFRNDDAR